MGLGLFSVFRDRRLLPRYSEVGEGIVSGFTEPDDEKFVRPRVRFVHGGGAVTIIGAVGSCPPAYHVGQRVAVRYPRGEPGLPIVADTEHLYSFELASIALGALGVGAAFVLLYLQER